MRLGVNARTFCVNQPGGATQASMQISSALADDPAVDVQYFGSSRMPARFRAHATTTGYPIRSQTYGILWERAVLPALARRADIDTLLCPTANAPVRGTDDFAIASYIHDINAQKNMSGRYQRHYRKRTVPRTIDVSDVLLTVSEFSKREIVAHFDIAPDDVSVVYNGIDDIYHDDSAGTPVDLPENYVLYVGAMNPRKNLTGLLTAFTEFRRRASDDYTLVLVGPDNKPIYRSLELPPDEHVLPLGYLQLPELKYVYQHADVFCFPSLYEGFGLPPLEAMACGTPVVASNTTSLPELLGDAAELVDPHDTTAIVDGLLAVTGDESYRAELVERGRERARTFTWQRAATELKETLQAHVE
jgi:glycosyltransferase involved in cell wall biosynthesis